MKALFSFLLMLVLFVICIAFYGAVMRVVFEIFMIGWRAL